MDDFNKVLEESGFDPDMIKLLKMMHNHNSLYKKIGEIQTQLFNLNIEWTGNFTFTILNVKNANIAEKTKTNLINDLEWCKTHQHLEI